MKDAKERVYQYLAEHQQEMGEFLSKLVQFDTQNFGPGGPAVEAEAQEHLYGEFEKHGFIHCGTIYLADGQLRYAYEKLV